MVIILDDPDPPGSFYHPPDPLPEVPPGTVIRQQKVAGLIPGTTAHKVLYMSTGLDGEPVAVSGVIYVPGGPVPKGGRKIVALNHGTTGVAERCAPSLVSDPVDTQAFDLGGPEFLRRKWVVAATDYQGLGTPGPHPYLVGQVAGRDALDIVRAARRLDETDAGREYAIWGHSQGGHASMFTGQLATQYAPELNLAGVAAAAPVPDPEAVLKTSSGNAFGRVLLSYVFDTWPQVYDLSLDGIVDDRSMRLIPKIAGRCLTTLNALAALPAAISLGKDFIIEKPWDIPAWERRIAENTPGRRPVSAPLLLVNGSEDGLVPWRTTRRLARGMCRFGNPVAFRLVPGAAHEPTGHEAAPMVARWLAARFTGERALSGCPNP